MSPPRRLWWGVPELPPPRHPYRDTLLVYGGLALVIVLVAWVTGGSLGKAVLIAVVFFIAATGWSSWRWRERLRAERRRAREGEAP